MTSAETAARLRVLLARAGVTLAVLFAGLATVVVERLPGHFEIRMLTPAWMPQQIARLVEFANDVQVALIADRGRGEHEVVALVLIREHTLEDLPYLSPIDRGLLARIVESLDALDARVIGLDIVLDQPTEPAKDERLLLVLSGARVAIVLGGIDERVALSERRRRWQSEFLARSGRPAGYFNLRYDAQEASGNPIIRYRAGAAPASALARSFAETVAEAAGVSGAPGSRRIAWLGAPYEGGETFLRIEADAVLAAADDPQGILARALRAQLAGKVVLVGADLPDRDRHPTPLTLFEEAGMAGVEVHAHILAQILDGRRLDDLRPPWRASLMAGSALAGFLIGWFAHGRRWLVTTLASLGLAVLAGVTGVLLWQMRAIVPIAGVAALFLSGLVAARLIRRLAGPI